MSNMSFAHRGYAAVQKEVKSDKAIELQVFMSITAKLRGLDKDSDTYTAVVFSRVYTRSQPQSDARPSQPRCFN